MRIIKENKSLADIKKELTPLGIEVKFDNDTDEFRVNFKGGKEATAYYTDDAEDALMTGKSMSKEKKKESTIVEVKEEVKIIQLLSSDNSFYDEMAYNFKTFDKGELVKRIKDWIKSNEGGMISQMRNPWNNSIKKLLTQYGLIENFLKKGKNMKNIIEVKEEVRVGDIILEKGDKLQIIKEAKMDIYGTRHNIVKRLEDSSQLVQNYYISEDLMMDSPKYRATVEKDLITLLRALDDFEKIVIHTVKK